jgi:hypothetical protein
MIITVPTPFALFFLVYMIVVVFTVPGLLVVLTILSHRRLVRIERNLGLEWEEPEPQAVNIIQFPPGGDAA